MVPPPRGPTSPPLHPFGKMGAIFFLFPLKVLESHGAESCSCRAEIVFCVTSSTATHATTALSFSITCTLVLERQPLKTLIRVILLAIRLEWIYYFVPVWYFLGFAHFFAPLWNVSKEVACLTWFLTTSTIANACSFSQEKSLHANCQRSGSSSSQDFQPSYATDEYGAPTTSG